MWLAALGDFRNWLILQAAKTLVAILQHAPDCSSLLRYAARHARRVD
jgi:hypothetical protein